MHEKFILLDIDGVMVPANSWKRVEIDVDGFYKFNPNSQLELNRLLMQSGAIIILTTTHRSKYNKYKWNEILRSRLKYTFDVRIIDDYLAFKSENNNRFNEIMQWGVGPGQNNQYVILDDDKSLYNLPYHIKEHWVPIQPMIGLNKETATQALKILNDLV